MKTIILGTLLTLLILTTSSSIGQNFIKINYNGKSYIGVTDSFMRAITKLDIDRKNCLLYNEMLSEQVKMQSQIIKNDSIDLYNLRSACKGYKQSFDVCNKAYQYGQEDYITLFGKYKGLKNISIVLVGAVVAEGLIILIK